MVLAFCWHYVFQGKVKPKVAALAILALDRHLAAMSLDEGLDDRQPQPQSPVALGTAFVRVEQAFKTFRLDSLTIIADPSFDHAFGLVVARAPMATSPRGVYRMALAIRFWITRLSKLASA